MKMAIRIRKACGIGASFLLLATAALKVPLILEAGRDGILDPVFTFLPHWKVLAVTAVLEACAAISLMGFLPPFRESPVPLLAFITCCIGYRMHLWLQGDLVCSCLGAMPRWIPWIDEADMGYVSGVFLGVLAVVGLTHAVAEHRAPGCPAGTHQH